jgi:hypothetical protein
VSASHEDGDGDNDDADDDDSRRGPLGCLTAQVTSALSLSEWFFTMTTPSFLATISTAFVCDIQSLGASVDGIVA